MRRKTGGVVILIIFVSMLLSACSNNFLPELRVNFKQNPQRNSGIASAVYGDRIYYVSNELGKSGIYSMELDGSDVRMEVENPSVIYLQVVDGELVYSGIYRADENNKSSLPATGYCHKIYETSRNTPQFTIINELLDKSRFNIVDAYRTGEGVTACTENAGLDGESYTTLYILKMEGGEILQEETFQFDYIWSQIENDRRVLEQETAEVKVDRYADATVLYRGEREEDENYYLYRSGAVLTDQSSHTLGIGIKYHILNMDGNIIHASFHNGNVFDRGMLIEIDLNKKEIRTNTPAGLGENERAVYAAEHNGEILVVTENATDYRELRLYPGNQKLQILDTETLELREIFAAGEEEQILAVQDEYIVTLEGNTIYKYILKDEIVNMRSRIAEINGLVKERSSPIEQYQVDTAGDWLFFYKIHGGYVSSYDIDMGQQLRYKINLETGEVLENTRELDFSELDPYRVQR